MIGRTLSHYEIVGLLGRGGMGEVYRALDTTLRREVALKVLPSEMACEPERLARFRREAETVAGIVHPHVVTLFSLEEAEGVHFLTMELVEGRSLDQDLPPGGLPLGRVLDLGVAIADALAAAHGRGVVHRDLKPGNVMVGADGRAKVLDFGLARLGEPAPGTVSEESLTRTSPMTRQGTVLGTVPYMSPEQLRGQPVDARSDLFSFGVLLYELATGRRPFHGPSEYDVTSAILRDDPAPLGEVRPGLPDGLQGIVARCLAKSPENRYASAVEARDDLRALQRAVESGLAMVTGPAGAGALPPVTAPPSRRAAARGRIARLGALVLVAGLVAVGAWLLGHRGPAGGPGAPESSSIAVLPFVNESGDARNDYFSDGVSEELLNQLARIPQLRVISRSSSFSFKGSTLGTREIARRLKVAHLLEGSVRTSGDRVRITAQLIDARTDHALWSETYDRTLHDIFAVQDGIAAAVVAQLRLKLLGGMPTARPTAPQAYALYLEARALGRQGARETSERAIALYRRALAIDPAYVDAAVGLAGEYLYEANRVLRPVDEACGLAREAADRALAIDPGAARAHLLKSQIAMNCANDLAAAAWEVQRALELEPTHIELLSMAGMVAQRLGQVEPAIALLRQVAARDPVRSSAYFNLALSELYAGRPRESIADIDTALTLSPGLLAARYLRGLAQSARGDDAGALATVRQEASEPYRLLGEAIVFQRLGRRADADTALQAMIRRHGAEWPYNIAYVFAQRGERDRAFEWLDRAAAIHDAGLNEIAVETLFQPLRSDPRWLPFLRRIGRAPEQLARIPFEIAPR